MPNKATADVRALALVHLPAVIERLAYLALHGESEQVQVTAGRELLDRAVGKAPQAVTADLRAEVSLAQLLAGTAIATAAAMGAESTDRAETRH